MDFGINPISFQFLRERLRFAGWLIKNWFIYLFNLGAPSSLLLFFRFAGICFDAEKQMAPINSLKFKSGKIFRLERKKRYLALKKFEIRYHFKFQRSQKNEWMIKASQNNRKEINYLSSFRRHSKSLSWHELLGRNDTEFRPRLRVLFLTQPAILLFCNKLIYFHEFNKYTEAGERKRERGFEENENSVSFSFPTPRLNEWLKAATILKISSNLNQYKDNSYLIMKR